jgi:hypothetical protein
MCLFQMIDEYSGVGITVYLGGIRGLYFSFKRFYVLGSVDWDGWGWVGVLWAACRLGKIVVHYWDSYL